MTDMAVELFASVAVKVGYSDSDIVPDELQNRLMYWRDVNRMASFDIGDITAQIIEAVAANGMKVTDQRVFEAVSSFCGYKPRTVRYYYETAVFYNVEARQSYNILPFSHFVAARTYAGRWMQFLDLAMLHPNWGVEKINFHLSSVAANPSVAADDPGCECLDYKSADREKFTDCDCKDLPDNLCECSQNTIPARADTHVSLGVVSSVNSQLSPLRAVVLNSKVCETSQTAILSAIEILERLLPEVSRSLV